MPYAINTGDIVQVTVWYHQPAIVRMMNVLHYRYTGVPSIPDGRAAIGTLLDTFGNEALTNSFPNRWRALASDQCVIEEFWGQRIYPVRYATVKRDVNIVGVDPVEPLPGLAQYGIEKRGDIAQRYAVGGIRVPGLAETNEAQSQLTGAALALAKLLADAVKAVITDTSGATWQPIVYRRTNPGSSVDVVETMAHGVISTQRSRIAFRGI